MKTDGSPPVRCRLCGAATNEVVLRLSGMPRWNHRLLKEAEVASDRGVDLDVHRCASCDFVSLPEQLNGDYYDDYVNAPSSSPQMQKFQTEQARAFVERFDLRGKSVLEVGCGDGYFLHALRESGAVCTGIEPSDGQLAIARARGLEVEAGFLSVGRRLTRGPFDAFATRQVFEHVTDLGAFLRAIRENLRHGAVGLVEVPNLDFLVAESRFFDFIPEHVNYFSSSSLSLALQLGGFDVLETTPVQGGEALRALVRLKDGIALDAIGARVLELRKAMADFVESCKQRGEKVAIWGAGGKGLSMLAVADLRGIDLLVDGDPHKNGRYTPVSHLRVNSPDVLAQAGIGAVIITAPTYQYEILRTLREKYGFSGRVAIIENGFKLAS